MARGYMGKILNVYLSEGRIVEEPLDEQLCQEYVGGYGMGARLLYERMPAGADPLGPDNILGLLTGPLTGTPALIGSRYVAVAKSPNTGLWGDANCGGYFGPHLKFAGVDGILFYGVSTKPVYLYIEEGVAEVRDASDLWGMNVSDLEDLLKERHGQDVQIASIGTAGEKLSLMACIMNDKERAAGRSGLGAVMGSKKLKAVVVKGTMAVPMADKERTNELRRTYLRRHDGAYEDFHDFGTCSITSDSAQNGDSPVKNWGGSGLVDFPRQRSDKIGGEANISLPDYKRYGCWRCPIACGGRLRQDSGKFALEKNDGVGHKPEYETLCMFGTNLLNDDLASIVKINEICNDHGLDTISVGATIGYVVECYENGLLDTAMTDELEMTWGNAEAIVVLTDKIARRDGFGDLLADGIKVAWEKLGEIGTEFAIHVHPRSALHPGPGQHLPARRHPGPPHAGRRVARAGRDGAQRAGQVHLYRRRREPLETGEHCARRQRRRDLPVRLPELSRSVRSRPAYGNHRLGVRPGRGVQDRPSHRHHAPRL